MVSKKVHVTNSINIYFLYFISFFKIQHGLFSGVNLSSLSALYKELQGAESKKRNHQSNLGKGLSEGNVFFLLIFPWNSVEKYFQTFSHL